MESFEDIFNSMKERVIVCRDGCFLLYQFLNYASKLDGEVAEVGVYQGATAKLLAKTCPDKPVHLFDTFKGVPDGVVLPIDKHLPGDFKVSLEEVKDYLKEHSNIRLHPGVFPSTAEPIKDKKFCFVHYDADLYKTTFDCLDFFYTRMVKGGVILFHDFKFSNCPGVEKAIADFLINKPEHPIELIVEYYCLIIKI